MVKAHNRRNCSIDSVGSLLEHSDHEAPADVTILISHNSYYFELGLRIEKAWLDVESPRFYDLQLIQYIRVLEFGAKLATTPTKLELSGTDKF